MLCWMVLLLGLGSCVAGLPPTRDFYRGQVVDIDTKKPLPSVVVVFFWQRDVYSPPTKRNITEFHAAVEAVTDADGRFQISAAPERTRDPSITHIASPTIIFFASGYVQYSHAGHGTEWRPGGDPALLYMKRVDDPHEALQWAQQVPSLVPMEAIPRLINSLNAERSRLGLTPIQPGVRGKGQ